ncbi:hypothetical protein H4Q26_003165 [Puccinia striiformis f. sp. tritici PST-130]|nr:hypothetical protein H4Q26_003165 [Puccinia striiformis f. sp. tritici PST-130]
MFLNADYRSWDPLRGLTCGSTITPNDFYSQWYLKYNPKLTREEVAKVDLDHKIRKLTIALSHKPPT